MRLALLVAALLSSSPAQADEAITQRDAWSGRVAHFLTGATLAEDTDSDNAVDSSAQPVSFDVSTTDVPSTATVEQATIYWGGTQNQSASSTSCDSTDADTEISLGLTDGSTATVTADECYCADGGATSYDIWLCKADVSTDVSSAGIHGTYTVDDYSGRYSGGATDNASTALLVVYSDSSLDPRRVVHYDGLVTMQYVTETLSLSGFDVDTTPGGTLTWYTLEGDVGGGGTEQVDVTGSGGASITLSDAINPSSNPMNRTINTTSPVQTGVVGVDIDQFDITGALTSGDTSITVDYQAGADKWWLAVNVVGVDQYDPVLDEDSEKTWTHYDDVDADGDVEPGDTVRYTITLTNTGNEDATTDVTDTIPAEAASWSLVSAGGGTDASTATVLYVTDVPVAAGSSTSIVFDVVIADVTDESSMSNTASWSAPAEGGDAGSVTATDVTIRRDGDSDGHYDNDDCDPADATVYPGATETCNGVDDDCDGTVDEGVTTRFYADADADGYGDASSTTDDCSAPSGYVSDATDCDDTDSSVNPAATELCNGVDDDCDGTVDEDDAADASTWYADADGDGYGDASITDSACDAPSGYVSDATDCDDTDGSVNPGATEVCNGVDDDCDGSVDEADASDASTWYADADGDGYGDASSTEAACDRPSGYVSDATDCDDTDSSVNPAATERCNGVDDDCDGTVDEDDASDASTFYADADGDGYGDASSTTEACDTPTGYVSDATDCDDTDSSVNPAATELCNGVDDDCDGTVDEDDASDASTWYADADGDGYGDASTTDDACEEPSGYVSDATDCDDGDATVNPGASEVAYDGIDQDCDGDDLCDADGDGYDHDGAECWGSDCNDNDAAMNPAAAESADGADEDCDGIVDEGTDYYDDDGDGYTEEGGDCDDGDADVHPAAEEVCDGVDQDCDEVIDEETECYDDDGDGYTEEDGDCNDGDVDAAPDLIEIEDNGVDDDCDGSVDGGVFDPDEDGYTVEGGDCDPEDGGTYPGAPEIADGVDNDCDGIVDEGTRLYDDDGDGWTERDGDCNDEDPDMHPDAEETEDGRDEDCDGEVDEGGERSDDDGDGLTEEGGDCDDDDPDVHPGAPETENGVDDDCDGEVDEGFEDLDGDGYAAADGDCDDENGWVHPGAAEVCDEVDNDCDGEVDEKCTGLQEQDADPGGCGCAAPGGALPPWPALIALVALRRRRAA